MDFKYVPVLRNGPSEMEALVHQKMSSKILPMIELTCKNPPVKLRDHFIASTLLVDIPMYLDISYKTRQNVRRFLTPIYDGKIDRCLYLRRLSGIKDMEIIPVISYNPNKPYVENTVIYQSRLLRKHFKTLAYRVFTEHAAQAVSEIEKALHLGDMVMLDVGEANLDSPSIEPLYTLINNLRRIYPCKTVLIRSALSISIKNTQLEDGVPIAKADNSLVYDYNRLYGFDSFGDYAGVRRYGMDKIGFTSPGFISYFGRENIYVGFKGIFKKPTTFTSMVLPKFTESVYWTRLSREHKYSCYGCYLIKNMLSKRLPADTAPRWKTAAIAHYIKSMDEII